MNRDEKIANDYLSSHYSQVIFEPDGNITPDFKIEDGIGIEVRRLNQQYERNGKTKGLEEDSIPLRRLIEKEFEKYPKSMSGNSFWVGFHFERGIKFKKKIIQQNLKDAIHDFESKGEITPTRYKIFDNLWITFATKGSFTGNNKYKIGIEADYNSGGFLISMYVSNVLHCATEKEKKITPYQSRYKQWWLLLIDYIGGIEHEDIEEIKSYLKIPKIFNKIIIIDVLGNTRMNFNNN